MPVENKDRWEAQFPDPENALPNGLVAYGGNLEPQTLLSAYGQGIFPWYSESEPILWWSPNPRCVLFPENFHISARSARKIRNSGFEYSIDRAFSEVLLGCAMPRKGDPGTWLLPEMQLAYEDLFNLGFAHSFEIWQRGALVGGVYGVVMGGAFFGESMFRMVPEASRAALVCLIAVMRRLAMNFLDCQLPTPHMLAMGATNITRDLFLSMIPGALSNHVSFTKKAGWQKFERVMGEICGIGPRRWRF